MGSTKQFIRYLLWAWVLATAISLGWNVWDEYRRVLERARIEARASFDKDLLFRRWATSHGGVYVPPTAKSPPNPYLNVPDRDVVTTGGKALTLINPAYMTRQVFELAGDSPGVHGHITSLKPLRPENAPDQWEQAALELFDRGAKEASERLTFGGRDVLRLMRPMLTEQGCLKCHSGQGYKVGEVRGGISVAVPLAPYWQSLWPHLATEAIVHLVLAGMGVGFLVFAGRRLDATWQVQLQAERDLRTVEQRWHVALEAVGDGLWDWNVETNEVFFSDTWKTMIGYAPEELRNHVDEWESRMHPDDLAGVMDAVQRHLAGETASYRSEHRIRCKDGSYKWILDRGCVISRAPDGRALRMVGTHKDLTETRDALTALSESEQRFATAFTDAPVGMAIRDLADGRYIEVNRACLTMTGYAREDVIGHTPAEVGWKVEAIGMDHRDPLMAPGGVRDAELRLRRKDGREIRCAYSNSMVEVGGRRCLLSITIDITDRRQAEQALRESERLLLATQRVAGLGSYVLDIPTGRWKSSAVLDLLFGITPQADHPVEDWLAIVHPDDRAAMGEYFLQQVIGRGVRFDREYRIVRQQDGAERWVHGVGELEFDAQKHPVRMIGTILDITERRRAEMAKALDTRTAQFLADLYAASLTVTDQELYDRVIESAVALTESEIGFLHRVSADQETIILTTWNRAAKENCTADAGTHYPLSQAGNWVDCVRERRPVVYNEFAHSPHQRGLPEGHVAVRRFMSIPVLAAGKVQVIFGVGNKAADYDAADLARLQMVATELQKVLERRAADQSLRESEQRYRVLVDNVAFPVALTSMQSGRVVFMNSAAAKTFGYAAAGSMNIDPNVHWRNAAQRAEGFRRLQETGRIDEMEVEYLTTAGTPIWLEAFARIIDYEGGQAILTVFRDIGERRQRDAQIRRISRLYLALCRVNEAIIHFRHRDQLLNEICRVLVGQGGFNLAWVGWHDSTKKLVVPVAQFGDHTNYTQNLHIRTDDAPTARGPSGHCLREGRTVVCNDFFNDPTTLPWREAATRAGFRASIALPIRVDGVVHGVLTVYAAEVNAFGDEEVVLLEGAARDIAFALEMIAREDARQAAESALVASEARFRRLFDSAVDAVYIHDFEGRIVDVNDEVTRHLGYTREELRRMNVRDIEAVVSEADRRGFWTRVLAGETVMTEGVHRRRDGTTFPMEVRVAAFTADQQPLIFASVRDITERHRAKRELADRERQLQAMLDASPACVKLVARDGTLVSINRVGLAMLDAAPLESVLGSSVYDFIAPEYREAYVRLNEQVCDGEKATLEYEIISRRGVRRWVETSAVPFRSDRHDGVVQLAVTNDITSKKADELERRRLARAVEQSPVTIVITDARGVIEYANPRFTETTGYSLAEARGQNPRLLKSGVQSESLYREMWAAISSGREWRGELCNRRKDGTLYWEEASISPVVDDAGRITHYLAVKEDITAQREAGEKLRQRAALLDVTQDAIFVLNLSREITYLNRSAGSIYGIDPVHVLGRRFEDVVYRTPPPEYPELWRQFLERGSIDTERRHIRPDGKELIVRSRASLICDETGQPHSVLLLVTDLTEAKAIEAHFLRAQRMESLGSLASGVAHDLNNVLTPILVATELLKPIARAEAEREVVQLVVDSARRGAEIVQQLLLFGRGSDTPRTSVDPGAVARGVVRMMQETFPKNLVLRSAIPKDLWPIEADRTQLHQVLLNLCVNARDAMPRGGDLALTALNTHVDEAFAARHLAAKPGPHVALCVADTGTGIPAAIVDKIFDPFFTTKPLGQGTGLGLATVLGITRSHGGFISVDTAEGRGARFTVYLPAKQSAALREATEVQRQQLSGRGELILLVDDEPPIRLITERALIKAGYRIVTAANGAEALAVFTRARADVRLVLTDVMMPIMDGPQLVHALRELSPTIPVVVMSGLRDPRGELAKHQSRHLRFLQKPFLIEAVLRVVREMLDEVAKAAAPQ